MNTVGYNHFNNLLFKVINSITECENYSSLIRELTKDNRLVYLPSRKEIFENCKENKNFCLAYADRKSTRLNSSHVF